MEKIQELTDKIYREGVEKGEAEAKRLVDDAKASADKILADAKAQADFSRGTEESSRVGCKHKIRT